MNNVLDLEGILPGLSSKILDAIKDEVALVKALPPPNKEAVCDELDKELKLTGKVACRATVDLFEDGILFMYQCLQAF